MNPILRMLIVSIAMITGFGSAISGTMMILVAPDPMLAISLPLLVGGLVMGIGGCVLLVMLNRRYLKEKLDAIRSDRASVLASWRDRHDREVILARSGLVLGGKVHAFDEWYSSLIAIELEAEGVLAATLRVSGGTRSYRPVARVVVPEELRESVAEGIAELRRLYIPGAPAS